MSPLAYVGAAYLSIWVLLLLYAWRLTRAARLLHERLDVVERRGEMTARR